MRRLSCVQVALVGAAARPLFAARRRRDSIIEHASPMSITRRCVPLRTHATTAQPLAEEKHDKSSTTTTSSSAAAAEINNGGSPASEKGGDGVVDRVVLDQVARSIHLSGTKGFEWIDFTATAQSVNAVLHDGGFVGASRRLLRKHQIAEDVISRVARDVWLPMTHVSQDGQTICLVTRVPYRVQDKTAPQADDSWFEPSVGEDGKAVSSRSSSDDDDGPFSTLEATGLDMTILDLTVRLNVFIHVAQRKIITVHRYPLQPVMDLQRHWAAKHRFETMQTLLFRLVRGSVVAFEKREAMYSRRLDALEGTLFRDEDAAAAASSDENMSRSMRGLPMNSMPQIQSRGVIARFLMPRNASFLKSRQQGTAANNPHNVNDHNYIMAQVQSINRHASATVRVLREVDGAYRVASSTLAEKLRSSREQQQTTTSSAVSANATNNKRDAEENASPPTKGGTNGGTSSLSPKELAEQASVSRRMKSLQVHIQSVSFMWEGIKEQSQALLSLQVSVAVSRLEELLRVLTVFSTIFIPLELITSIFGMNFPAMHLLGANRGAEWLAFAVMLVTALLTRRWIHKTAASVTVGKT